MYKVNLGKIFETLKQDLGPNNWSQLDVAVRDFRNCVTLLIDGEKYISTVSFWPNGLCDIDSIDVASEKPEFKHFVFSTNEEASHVITNELRKLISKN